MKGRKFLYREGAAEVREIAGRKVFVVEVTSFSEEAIQSQEAVAYACMAAENNGYKSYTGREEGKCEQVDVLTFKRTVVFRDQTVDALFE
jgi:hypothetical protein